MSCGVGCRSCSDPELLWLWRRPGATALMRPLAWEPPYATGAAVGKTKKNNHFSCCFITYLHLVKAGLDHKLPGFI